VGRYLRDYERVKLLVSHNMTAEQISPIAGLRPLLSMLMSNWCKNIILTYYQIREKAQLGLDKGDICHYSNSRYIN
jgi:hypothetical protein